MATPHPRRARTSRDRYRRFVEDYRAGRLDEQTQRRNAGERPDAEPAAGAAPTPTSARPWSGLNRKYVREYARWLWPHRYQAALVFALALVIAGLEMVRLLCSCSTHWIHDSVPATWQRVCFAK